MLGLARQALFQSLAAIFVFCYPTKCIKSCLNHENALLGWRGLPELVPNDLTAQDSDSDNDGPVLFDPMTCEHRMRIPG
jgi:hypothetical protein